MRDVKKIFIRTYGCKMNKFDTKTIVEQNWEKRITKTWNKYNMDLH